MPFFFVSYCFRDALPPAPIHARVFSGEKGSKTTKLFLGIQYSFAGRGRRGRVSHFAVFLYRSPGWLGWDTSGIDPSGSARLGNCQKLGRKRKRLLARGAQQRTFCFFLVAPRRDWRLLSIALHCTALHRTALPRALDSRRPPQRIPRACRSVLHHLSRRVLRVRAVRVRPGIDGVVPCRTRLGKAGQG